LKRAIYGAPHNVIFSIVLLLPAS